MRFILGALLLCLGAAGASAEPVKIGLVGVLTGPQATLGQQVRDGFMLGMEQLGGKLGGQPAEITVIDDEMKPDGAVAKVRGYLEREHAPIIVGPTFSNIMAAIARPTLEGGAILISPNAGSTAFAGKGCSPDIFVTSFPNDGPHAAMGKVAQDRGYKRVFLLAPNYQAGRDAMAGFKRFYRGEVIDEVYVPLTTIDFQSEIAKIAAAKPDAVFAFMPGGLGVNLVKQYRQAGLASIPFLSAFTVDESTLPAQRDAALGFLSAADWAPNLDNPGNKAFVAAFETKYGYVPGLYAAHGYDTAMLLDSALRATGGRTDDKAALRAALDKADFSSVRGPFRFGKNHYPVQDYWLVEVVKRPDGKYQTEARERILTADVDPYAVACKMQP